MEEIKCFIRKNTPKLRKYIRDLGFVLIDSLKKRAVWLDYLSNIPNNVYGAPLLEWETLEEDEKQYLIDSETDGSIDCGTNEDLFLALITYNSELMGEYWFIWDIDGKKEWHKGEIVTNRKCHRATVEELIEHFKKDNNGK